MKHKVYGSRIFSPESRRKLIFWQEKGTKILKENIGKELKRHKDILKQREKYGMEDQVIIFYLAVPIKYRDIISTSGFIKDELNQAFEDFEFEILEHSSIMGEDIENNIDCKVIGKHEKGFIIKDCYRIMNYWKERYKKHENETRTFSSPLRKGNCFYGIKKKN